MSRKNVKISEVTHEQLEIRKETGDTFDDVLKRELGIYPEDISELVAFYPSRLAWGASESLELLSDEADLREIIVEQGDYYAMNFNSETGHTILQARFHNEPTEGMRVYYRDTHGEFQHLMGTWAYEDELQDDTTPLDDVAAEFVWEGGSAESWEVVDDEQFLADIRPKIRGSKRRWGNQ